MMETHDNSKSPPDDRSRSQKAIGWLLKVATFFVILEPIWMLLPFAGFLYGSVMHIQLLSRDPSTAWLVHFVLPTHTLFPAGLILMAVGFSIFLVGAVQIYAAKIHKRGLVTGGIYRKFRHPQYLSLTLFGVGILLTWGRFITYIAFFIMMWLYYFLSKSEERKCRSLFGKQYEAYRRNTWFLFPGERRLIDLLPKSIHSFLPTWAKVSISFVLVIGLSIGSGLLIQHIKRELRPHPPAIQGELALSEDGRRTIKLVMVKGPALQAAPFEKTRRPFMDKAFQMLKTSKKIRQAMLQIGLDHRHTVLVFVNPGPNWHSGTHHDYRAAAINAYMVVTAPALDPTHENLFQKNHAIPILKVIQARSLSYARLEKGRDPAEGLVTISGPPMGRFDAAFQKKIQARVNFFSSGL